MATWKLGMLAAFLRRMSWTTNSIEIHSWNSSRSSYKKDLKSAGSSLYMVLCSGDPFLHPPGSSPCPVGKHCHPRVGGLTINAFAQGAAQPSKAFALSPGHLLQNHSWDKCFPLTHHWTNACFGLSAQHKLDDWEVSKQEICCDMPTRLNTSNQARSRGARGISPSCHSNAMDSNSRLLLQSNRVSKHHANHSSSVVHPFWHFLTWISYFTPRPRHLVQDYLKSKSKHVFQHRLLKKPKFVLLNVILETKFLTSTSICYLENSYGSQTLDK